MTTGRVDLDELARLEEERDFLLRSIADLDREREAGDVDPGDYEELHRGYVARAAAAMRAIEDRTGALDERRAAAPPPGRGRRVAVVGGVAAFALVAGVLLAGAVGSRGESQITGAGAMPGEAADRCRSLSVREPEQAIDCYDELLEDRPDDVDALTYQGWAKVRSGDPEGAAAQFDRVVELEPTYPDVRVFRASIRKEAGDFAGAQAELDALYALDPAPVVLSTLRQMGLDTEVALGLLPADVAECWTTEAQGLDAVSTALGVTDVDDVDRADALAGFADLATAVRCLDAVVEARPDDLDALLLRSLAVGTLGLLDPQAVPAAIADADRALAVAADDPTALLLRAVWRQRSGDTAGAEADLDALGERRTSALVGAYLDRRQVVAEVSAASAADDATTTTR